METVPLEIHRFKSKKCASVSVEFALFNWCSVGISGPPFGQSLSLDILVNSFNTNKVFSYRFDFSLSKYLVMHCDTIAKFFKN